MDNQLILTFVILIAALILFLTEKLPADLVALLVVVALGLSGILTPQEAFSGFSRSAVITIMAIFILAEALQRTGVTEQVGNILLKVGGKSELRLVIVVMIAGAFLSLFMNNIAAAAVLLPAASGAAKKAQVNSSKLLMPLAFGTILGGMATLLTTSNIVLSSLLNDNNLPGFSLTDFAPVGVPMLIAGILYVAFIGRKMLPGESLIERSIAPNKEEQQDLIAAYHLDQNLFRARVPHESFLIGKSLSESTLRDNKKLFALLPETEIETGDTLVLEGDETAFKKRDVEPFMEFLPASEWHESDLESQAVEVVEAMLAPRSRFIGETLRSLHFRERYGMSVLALWRGDQEIIADMADEPLVFGDALLLQGSREKLGVISKDPDLLLLTKTNAAGLMADGVVGLLGGYGGLVLLAGLFIVTTLMTQAVNGAVVAAVIGPVAIKIAQQTGIDPRSLAMGVALATSMAFMTPLGHPVNVLVMSPGGYNFRDFVKVGVPLSILLFIVAMIFLPLFWSL
jgi:di/tricarboxylate transporter